MNDESRKTESAAACSGSARHPVSSPPHSRWSSDSAILIYFALATLVAHCLTSNRYGFHRDELAMLDDARHLAWGYVAYPPITPFFGRLSLLLFGTSLAGFRFFSGLAQAAALLLTGLMAREMGGRRAAQLVAAAATLPWCLALGSLMTYSSFDFFFWVLAAYFVVKRLKTGDRRWWLAIGAAIGLGMMAKYSMLFFAAGIAAAVLLTDLRSDLRSRWLWYGVGVSLVIFLPNLLWEALHQFISLDFLIHIHARDIAIGRAKGFFFPGQFQITMLAFPLWLAGLYHCLVRKAARPFRALGWMYLVTLVLFIAGKGRLYYLAPGYPMLYAAGSVWGERWVASLRLGWAWALRVTVVMLLAIDLAVMAMFALPVFPIESQGFKSQIKADNALAEEFGWQELVATIAKIRDGLSPADRASLGILAGNYGEAGAIDLYGPRYGLPGALSGVDSYWQRGYGNPPPQTLIVVGFDRDFLAGNFSSCRVAALNGNRYQVPNEESLYHREIYVCRGLRPSWPAFWKALLAFA